MEFTEEDFEKGVPIFRADSPPGGDKAFSQEDLDRLLGEGYSLTEPSQSTEGVTSNEDFFDKLQSVFDNFGKSSAASTPEDVLTPEQIEDIVPWLKGKGSLLQTYTDQ